MDDVGDVMSRDSVSPIFRLRYVRDDNRSTLRHRRKVACGGRVKRRCIQYNQAGVRISLQPMARQHAHDKASGTRNQ
jgi:hypothetical protein